MRPEGTPNRGRFVDEHPDLWNMPGARNDDLIEAACKAAEADPNRRIPWDWMLTEGERMGLDEDIRGITCVTAFDVFEHEFVRIADGVTVPPSEGWDAIRALGPSGRGDPTAARQLQVYYRLKDSALLSRAG